MKTISATNNRLRFLCTLIAVCLLLSVIPVGIFASVGDVEINETNFPDPIFRQYIIDNFDDNSDGFLSTTEANVSSVDVAETGVRNLKGLELLNFSRLYINKNKITSLDLDWMEDNTLATNGWQANDQKLVIITDQRSVDLTQFGTISRMKDLAGGTLDGNIYTLTEGNNDITYDYQTSYPGFGMTVTITLSSDVPLTAEYFPDENFRSYISTLANTTADEVLTLAERSAVTEIDIHKGSGVSDEQKVGSIEGIEYFTALETLSCDNNMIAYADLSKNTALTSIDMGTQKISVNVYLPEAEIDIRNFVQDASRVVVTGGGTLTNGIISVAEDAEQITYTYKLFEDKTDTMSVVLDITYISAVEINETNFPDATFREYIKTNFDSNDDGALVSSEREAVTQITVASKGIRSLKGIEHFTEVTHLRCYYNSITELDLSKNTALTNLYCYGNELTALDLSKNTALKYLDCDDNKITHLDLSNNLLLETLYCSRNCLTYLDLGANENLSSVDVDEQTYYHDFGSGNTLDLTTLSGGKIDPTKISELKNAAVSGNILTAQYPNRTISYIYNVNDDLEMNVIINTPKTTIEEFNIVIDESKLPTFKAGESSYIDPQVLADATRGTRISISDARWYCDCNSMDFDASDKSRTFSHNCQYALELGLDIDLGYEFTTEAYEAGRYTFNGESFEYFDDYGTYCYAYITLGEVTDAPERDTAVDGFDLILPEDKFASPAAGGTPIRDEDIFKDFAADKNFEYQEFYWYDVTNDAEIDEYEIFSEKSSHMLALVLVPKAGYYFDADNAEKYKLNGKAPADVYQSLYSESGYIYLYYDYGTTEENPSQQEYIFYYNLTLPEDFAPPITGEFVYRDKTLLDKMKGDNNFDVVYAYWYADEDRPVGDINNKVNVFKENTTYYLELTIVPESGYQFLMYPDAMFLLDGKKPVEINEYNGVMYAVYEIGTTGAYHEHDYSMLQHSENEHWHICSVCSLEKAGSRVAHSGGSASCSEGAKCATCGISYGAPTGEHSYTELVCGSAAHWHECAVCGLEKAGDRAAHANGDDHICDTCGYVGKAAAVTPPTQYQEPAEEPVVEEPLAEEPESGISTGAVIALTAAAVIAAEAAALAIVWFVILKKKLADLALVFKK